MHFLYFITAHGYGHGVRACTIANQISPEHKVTFRTVLPFQFFKEEMKRDFIHVPGKFDCGCIQRDGVTVDVTETLQAYHNLAQSNEKRIASELDWCKRERVDCIISDITPFAFELAGKLGIPSVAISNFTWYDIYKEYVDENSSYVEMLRHIQNSYASATILLALEPALPMEYFPRQCAAPVVGRPGKRIREELAHYYGISPKKKIALIYVGDFGLPAAWESLVQFSDWEFLGLHQLHSDVRNYHSIDKSKFRYQDLTASADVVISKIGYGVYSECVLNGTPLMYLPRKQFAEYPVLERAVKLWGGGYALSEEQFCSLFWRDALESCITTGILPVNQVDGARFCAEIIQKMHF